MSVFRKIRSSRNSVVVQDELGDCDVAKVRAGQSRQKCPRVPLPKYPIPIKDDTVAEN